MMHYYEYYSAYPVSPFQGLLAGLFYFLPAIIAFIRRHHNALPIFLLNLLLGWTMIGWVVNWCFWMMPWIVRAIWSEAPPAEKGTTISIGFVGSQARAGAIAPSERIAASQCCFMVVLSRDRALTALWERP